MSIEHSLQPNISERRSYTEGDVVEIECEKGYYPFGNSLMQCHPDGYWEGRPHLPLCELIVCPLPESSHLQIQGGNNFNATVTFQCEEGFTLVGDSVASCQDDGLWNVSFPECALVDCGAPIPLSNGSIQSDLTSFGSNAVYRCNPGYKFNMTSSSAETAVVTCASNGTWSTLKANCVPVHCLDSVVINNGQLNISRSSFGGKALLICDDGYMASNGVTSSLCDAAGLWFPPVRAPCMIGHVNIGIIF